MGKIRVVLVEDHDLTRIGLRTSLMQCADIELLAEANNGADGLKLLRDLKPDLAIVDIGLPELDGVEVTRQLKEELEKSPGGSDTTKILILTLQDDREAVLAAFAAGADSYCMKDVTFDHLVEAVKTTYSGNSWIDPAIARIVLNQVQLPGNGTEATIAIQATSPEDQQLLESSPLTERELEVLQLIVDGCSNSEIAERLFITVGTVKTHVRNILNKLCADDRTQAAVRALRSGLVG
ncbi:response regulator transcription factor [[Limnothrix rosea] IAM M-220]|uniref:response regulator transcription factor n=1 Tax=[Limnothrix rosea] IAM M-220 TaxID=454133 RepID=UPI00095E1953|nr:response regulator transcription factor [[Limnothrix rosea] IAM M-220]OKH19015.1 DNA-binding response regulator [[Limnothrix rosea] IAM M-220]